MNPPAVWAGGLVVLHVRTSEARAISHRPADPASLPLVQRKTIGTCMCVGTPGRLSGRV